ncbi:MAG: hypothetical protein Kow00107_08370 [Planctomycetota bacterium]
MRDYRPYLSIIVPVYNEADLLPEFVRRLESAMEETRKQWDVIFVDDGSTDGTWMKVEEYRARDRRYRTVRLEANTGRESALCAGFRFANSKYCATISVDLQYDPADIPRMLTLIEQEGCDMVACFVEKSNAGNEPYRNVDRILLDRATGGRLKDPVCSLRLYSYGLINRAQSYNGNTFSPQVLLPRIAHTYCQMPVVRHKRFVGKNRLPRGPYALPKSFQSCWNTLDVLSMAGISAGAVIAITGILSATFGGVFGVSEYYEGIKEISHRFSLTMLVVGVIGGLTLSMLSWALRRMVLSMLPIPVPVRYNAARNTPRAATSRDARIVSETASPSPQQQRQREQRDDRRFESTRRSANVNQDPSPTVPETGIEIPESDGPLSFEGVVQIVNRNGTSNGEEKREQQKRPSQLRVTPRQTRLRPDPEEPAIHRFGGEFDDIDELDDLPYEETRQVESEPEEKDEAEKAKEKDPRLAKTRRRYYPPRRRKLTEGGTNSAGDD